MGFFHAVGTLLLSTAACCFLCAIQVVALPQSATKQGGVKSAQATHKLAVRKTLPDTGIVSPEAIAKSLKPPSKKPSASASKASSSTAAAGSGVQEFQIVSPDMLGGAPGPTKSSKGKWLKNVHGEVYGATGSGGAPGNQAGGAVGATSKSGKTSIFMQTDHVSGPEPVGR